MSMENCGEQMSTSGCNICALKTEARQAVHVQPVGNFVVRAVSLGGRVQKVSLDELFRGRRTPEGG